MIELENVAYSYGGGELLSDITLRLAAGSFHFLTGPSGSGKTTLIKLCYGALFPTAGTLRLFDTDVRALGRNDIAQIRRRIGVVHQDCQFLDHLPLKENVALPLHVSGRSKEADGQDIDDLMHWVGLAGRADALPPQLSGGERQRAALARAVIMSPDVILADEPTGNVDWEMSQRLLRLLIELNRMGKTVLVATHDLSLVRTTKSFVQARVLRIANRRIPACGGRSVKAAIGPLRMLLARDRQADRVVPASGFTAQLTLFAAAAMAFLAVFALALSLAAGRLADRWADELARSATIRITAPPDQQSAQVDATLRILETTRGVETARAMSNAEQKELLAPWFGTDLALDALPVPRLIEIVEDGDGMDAEGLRLRLAGEVPGAVLDDHIRWRAPLVGAASHLRALGWISTGLIAAVLVAMVTLAANAALSANAQVIGVLRLVGATDAYIAQAFIRRFTLRTLAGAVGGVALGLTGVLLMPGGGDETATFLIKLTFQGWHWLVPLMIPPLAALVAFVATRLAARRTLQALP